MTNVTYKLKSEELKKYYTLALKNDSEVIKFHWRLRLFVPAGILFFLIFSARKLWVWLIGIALIIIWLIIADKVLFKKYLNTLITNYTDPTKIKLSQMNIQIDDKELIVNKVKQNIFDYAVLDDLIVIILDNKANILIPLRVFDNNDKTEKFISEIENLCPLYKEKKENN